MKAGKTRRHGWMNEGLVSEAGREGGRWTEIRGGEQSAPQREGREWEKKGGGSWEINQKRRRKVKRK